MKTLTETLKAFFLRDEGKALPIVKEKREVTDPVYHFFVHEKSNQRKKVYDKALKAAEADQQEVIRKYETIQKDLVSA